VQQQIQVFANAVAVDRRKNYRKDPKIQSSDNRVRSIEHLPGRGNFPYAGSVTGILQALLALRQHHLPQISEFP
jgi:hypothetical protein